MSFPLASLAKNDMQCVDLLKNELRKESLICDSCCWTILVENRKDNAFHLSAYLFHPTIHIYEMLHCETTILNIHAIPIYDIQQKWKTCEAYDSLFLTQS